MRAYVTDGPGFVTPVEVPDEREPLRPGQVRVRLKLAGLCGSDMPKLNGIVVRKSAALSDEAPVHEIVGEVIESASDELQVGQRVAGTNGAGGLREIVVVSDQSLIPVPHELDDLEAVSIQSLGTVIRAADRLPGVTGLRVAVIGAGPIGLGFLHVLRHRGAAHLTSIDPVDHRDVALRFGADDYVQLRSTQWADAIEDAQRPDLVIEAVGHQHATISDAIRAVATTGVIYGFGSPDDPDYVIPYQQIYERGLTLLAGRTLEGWRDVLRKSRDYVLAYRDDFREYVSHTIPFDDAQRAYSLYARPQAGRLKIAIAVG